MTITMMRASLIAAAACCCVKGANLSLSERLFRAALPLANQSLQGQFISQMADGSLPKHVFQWYLHQDNLYLGKYARAFAVMAARVENGDELTTLLNLSVGFLDEHTTATTATETSKFDATVFARDAAPITVAYTSFLTQAAWADKLLFAYAAVLPCQKLYDWLFSELNATRHIASDNPYKHFIEQYAESRNHKVTKLLEGFLDRHAMAVTGTAQAQAQFYYDKAMRYEADFFQQSFSADLRQQPPVSLASRRSLQQAKRPGGAVLIQSSAKTATYATVGFCVGTALLILIVATKCRTQTGVSDLRLLA